MMKLALLALVGLACAHALPGTIQQDEWSEVQVKSPHKEIAMMALWSVCALSFALLASDFFAFFALSFTLFIIDHWVTAPKMPS